MTEDLTRKIPAGIRWEFRHKQLVLECKTCHRRWKGDGLGNPDNTVWLRQHVAEHVAPETRQEQLDGAFLEA